jgi:hypothetical protein
VSGYAGLEIVAKQLELLKETVPKIRRVAILSNPANAYHQLAIKEVNVAARSLGVQLQLLDRTFYFGNAQVLNPTHLLFIGDGQLLDTG